MIEDKIETIKFNEDNYCELYSDYLQYFKKEDGRLKIHMMFYSSISPLLTKIYSEKGLTIF